MDLPRAELRTRGLRAVLAALTRRRHRVATWLRPRAAPLAITAIATLGMLAGLDLIAHDLRQMRRGPTVREPVIYLMSMPADGSEIIPVELASPADVEAAAASPVRPRCTHPE